MPGMIFAFLITVVSLGAVLLMLLLFTQAQNRAATRRQEAFYKALDAGVYDQKLLGGKKRRGHALLGWGIIFVAAGLGILIGLGSMTDPNVLRDGGITGSMIPMLIGIGMIVFYFLLRKLSNGNDETNGEPVSLDRENGSKPPRIDA